MPTIIRIGLIAVFGISEIHGIINIVAKNKRLAITAALPVLPFEAITAAFSADETVGDVPEDAQVNAENAASLYDFSYLSFRLSIWSCPCIRPIFSKMRIIAKGKTARQNESLPIAPNDGIKMRSFALNEIG